MAGAGDGVTGRRVDLQRVVAVDDHAGHQVGARVRGDIDARVLDGHRIVRRVLVVLAHEHDGQLPHRGDVERLVELPLGGRAVAEEAHGHVAPALHLGGQRRPAGDRQAAPDDAIGAEHAHREVGDVHGAALALAIAVHPPEQLRHHAADVGALGDAMAMAPVGADHAVAHGQGRAHPDRHGLLAHVGMHRAVDLPGHPQLDGQLVELPDQHLDEVRRVERHRVTSPDRLTSIVDQSRRARFPRVARHRRVKVRSSRNRPPDLGEEGKPGPMARAFEQGLDDRLAGGYPPSEVAAQVVQGIREGRLYIVPAQPEVKAATALRAQDILELRNPTLRRRG